MTTAFWVVVMLFGIFSCSQEVKEYSNAVVDRTAVPRVRAFDIVSMVSDSGITRYRIQTPEWDEYDKAARPYWEFPYGINFERFDLQMKVNANIHAKYAKFLQREQIWELRGEVKATNVNGELFETEQLFWDQRKEKIYSDSVISITQEHLIIIGVGFDSNQEMTDYQIRDIQGTIPVNE